MIREMESLVDCYDTGQLDRRGLMRRLLMIAAAPAIGSAAVPGAADAEAGISARRSPGTSSAPQANSLNHVTLAVESIDRAQAFYERVLGVSEVSRQSNGVNLGLGESFLGLYDLDPPGEIHHFCVGVDGYDIERTAAELRELGVTPQIRQDRPELYFNDPDGNRVQLSKKEYRG